MVTEWDKLWEKFKVETAPDSWYAKVKAVGDGLQAQVDELNRELHIADKQLEAIREIVDYYPDTEYYNVKAYHKILEVLV